MVTIMPNISVWLGLMPAFYTKHLGVTYGEAYYFDFAYRAEVMRRESLFLYELFGDLGVGEADPQPVPAIFVQPIDLMLHTQGAPWRFPDDAPLESIGAPWAGKSLEEIAAIDPQDAARHPVMDRLLAQYAALEAVYGDRADIFGVKSGTMNIHTPYTTAHQLCGEALFELLMFEPEAVQIIFSTVWALYQAIYARVWAATGTRASRLYLGDCSASLLSAEVYASQVLPFNCRLAEQYPALGYHSCGKSSHLLADFARLPHLDAIQLGAYTDMAEAARRLPGVILEPLVDPVLLREGTADDVYAYISTMVSDCAPAPAVHLCAWSFDRDTPFDNVRAMYRAVADMQACV
jgi:hypothetical protein